MIEIPLTQGQVALIDDEDFDIVSAYKWYAHWKPNGRRFYAITNISRTLGRGTLKMHRLVFGLKDPLIHVDHIDGDGLNNCRHNLRLCTNTQNHMNLRRYANNTSGLTGVFFEKRRQKWRAEICAQRKRRFLGYFDDAESAAAAYASAAREIFGAFSPIERRLKDQFNLRKECRVNGKGAA